MLSDRQNNSLLKTILIRCYAELNDFLPPDRRQKNFPLSLKMPVTVAEALQSIGIPLAEIDLVLVNSEPAPLNRRLMDGDQVSAYPTFESFDISQLKDKLSPPLRHTQFILDAHLGKLAKYLRMLGFDTLYRNDFGDEEIIDMAADENRIILTRDKLLLKSPKVSHGYYVRAIEKHEQLNEVVKKFDLVSQFKTFTRCMTCNSILLPKKKEEIREKIDEDTARVFNEFFFCPDCDKVFWKGSHFERMEKLILSLLD